MVQLLSASYLSQRGRALKLVVYTENYARGGGNRYMVDLINSIASEYSQIVFISNPEGIYSEDLARMQAPWRHSKVNIVTRVGLEVRWRNLFGVTLAKLLLSLLEPSFMLWNIMLLWRKLVREAPDRIIVCNGGYPGAQSCLGAVLASRLSRRPSWLTIASMPADRRWQLRWYESVLDWLVWRSCDRVVVNADAISASLVDLRGVIRNKVVVIRNGVEMLPPRLQGQNDSRSLVIGCVARMDAMKGVLILLEAFITLAKEHSQIRLILVGEGDASPQLRERIAKAGLADRVTMMGHFSGNVHELLLTFNIFAFPSLWEGLPYSVVEAMRAGCSIVATRVGGVPEAIRHEYEGLLINAGDGDDLLAALNRLVNDLVLRDTLADGARRRFEQEFSIERMHQHGRQVLLEVV